MTSLSASDDVKKRGKMDLCDSRPETPPARQSRPSACRLNESHVTKRVVGDGEKKGKFSLKVNSWQNYRHHTSPCIRTDRNLLIAAEGPLDASAAETAGTSREILAGDAWGLVVSVAILEVEEEFSFPTEMNSKNKN